MVIISFLPNYMIIFAKMMAWLHKGEWRFYMGIENVV